MIENGYWNSFKRVDAVFDGEIPDRVPKYEGSIEIKELNPMVDGQSSPRAMLFFSPAQIRIFHKFPALLSMAKSLVKLQKVLDPIAAYVVKSYTKIYRKLKYDIFPFTSGVPMVFNERLFRDFNVRSKGKIIEHVSGRVVWKVSLGGAHFRNGFITTPAEWDKYMEFDPDHEANYFIAEQVQKTSKKLDIVPFFTIYGATAFEELCGIFGFETLFKLMIKNKNFVKRIIKQFSDFAVASAEKVIGEYGAKYVYFSGDLGSKGRSLISPRMYREFFKPIYKRICKKVHSLGGKVFYHSCGHVMNLIDDFIDVGIDALHPIEREAGNDIVEIKKKYGKKLILFGNVPIPLLTNGTLKEVRQYVRYLLENVSKDGGHVISSSHSITQWCKLKNYLEYIRIANNEGIYPIKTNLPHS
ncbi:MAG: uroporphyrinogen decarboxylase family protein [Promethearchaeota archaeon]